jgi:hypothetical protein
MRRFETDYAGAWRGYCKTRESAIIAGVRHILQDGYTACTITDRETGMFVARVSLDPTRRRAVVETQKIIKRVVR